MSVRATVDAVCPAILRPYWERLEASPIGVRLARGVFWSLAGTLISRGLTLASTVVVARILGKTVYGELGMIQSTVGMFGVLAGFGLGLTATKHVAEFRHSDPARAGRILALSNLVALCSGGVMALGLLLFAPWVASSTINAPHLAGTLRIGAIMLFLSALNGAQTGALAGFEAFRTIARVNLAVGVASFPVLVAGAYWGGLVGAVWALAGNLAINWFCNHLALRHEARRHGVPLHVRTCGKEWAILWNFSLPAALDSAVVGPVTWACSALLVNEPGGYEQMGVFSAANQWFSVLLFIPGALGSVVLPMLSSQMGQKDTSGSGTTLALAIKANALIVLPLAVLASLLSSHIMALYGQSFRDGWPTLIVILATASLLAIQTPVGQIIAASGRMWLGFAMNMGWALAFITCTLLMVGYGSFGLALARGVAYVLHATWTLGFAALLLRASKQSVAPQGD